MRRFLTKVHRWLGLAATALFALLGLSGSLIVYHDEIDRWTWSDLFDIERGGKHLPPHVLVERAVKEVGGLSVARGVSFPLDGTTAVSVFVARADAPYESWREIAVDPVTAAVLGSRVRDDHWIFVVYDLHANLLLGRPGEVATGIVALFALLSVATGIYLWWPKKGRWRAALTFPSGTLGKGRWRQFAYQGHKLAGIYSAIVIIIVSATGAYMAFPDQAIAILDAGLTYDEFPDAQPSPICRGRLQAPLEEIFTLIEDRFPNAHLTSLDFPYAHSPLYEASLAVPGDPRRITGGTTKVWIDGACPAITAVYDPVRSAAGNMVDAYVFPLHNGEALGHAGRLVVFASGLLLFGLTVTGVLIWSLKKGWLRR